MNSWKWMFLVLNLYLTACASDPYSETTNYDNNRFYVGQPPIPSHPKKASVDFFDVTCERAGKHDGYRGEVFDCHYTGE